MWNSGKAIARKPHYSHLFGFASCHSTVDDCSHSLWLILINRIWHQWKCRCAVQMLSMWAGITSFTVVLHLREHAHLVWGKYLTGAFKVVYPLRAPKNISPFLVHFDSMWCCVAKCNWFSVFLRQAVFCEKKSLPTALPFSRLLGILISCPLLQLLLYPTERSINISQHVV